jgi:urea transport system substrate-binding protein
MRLQIEELGGKVIGEKYRPLGDQNFLPIVKNIKEVQPDVILNTINGDSNIAFFEELRKEGITSENIPVISFSLAEDELRVLGAEKMVGDYAVWNYFQSVKNSENEKFVRNFKELYGEERVLDDPMEAGYIGVYLWAAAVEKAGTFDEREVRKAVLGIEFNAPEGVVKVDSENQHLWKTIRV